MTFAAAGELLAAIDRIEPVAGRSWRWAPDWPCSDAAVLFDRHSGDYWVLTPQARALIRSLEESACMTVPQLRSVPGAPGADADLEELLGDLMRGGLVRAWDNARRPLAAPEPPDID